MKTTFDLPPDLVRKVKLRAVNEGRKLKDVAAELSAVTQSAPPDGHLLGFKVHHFRM